MDEAQPANFPEFRFSLRTLFAVTTLFCLVAWLLPGWDNYHWIGRTDLKVRFLVVDWATGEPIPNATVNIRLEDAIDENCDECSQADLVITTDVNGEVTHVIECSAAGTKGPYKDTFHVHLPYWCYSASAADFETSRCTALDSGENRDRVQRGKSVATIDIPIGLISKTPPRDFDESSHPVSDLPPKP